jgi:predicted CoA-substrate-specific enzyme activase
MRGYLGVDVGSVSTNLVLLDESLSLRAKVYLRTQGNPVTAVQRGLFGIGSQLAEETEILGVCTTGSARFLTGVVVGADTVKNEITAHAIAALHLLPDVRTVLEIGGQDSKIIIVEDGVVTDFAMNTVCAAGTGSFLDHQATRLGIPIEEFGAYALRSEHAAQIAGRCGVFAESDMIHKQQMGCATSDIVLGLCEALVRNYLNNIAKGKTIEGPIVFQGGVAANAGMKRAFEEALGTEVIVPEHFEVMGAIGCALIACEHRLGRNGASAFRGFQASEFEYKTSSFRCTGCANTCEVIRVEVADELLARWGGRCGKWDVGAPESAPSSEPVFVPTLHA